MKKIVRHMVLMSMFLLVCATKSMDLNTLNQEIAQKEKELEACKAESFVLYKNYEKTCIQNSSIEYQEQFLFVHIPKLGLGKEPAQWREKMSVLSQKCRALESDLEALKLKK